ncbi:hypothetical protein LINPERPRIM_LOCUS22190 [Linum perenne]
MIHQCCPDANQYSYTPPGSPVRGRTLGPHKKRVDPRTGHLQALKPRYDMKYRLRPSLAGRKTPRDGMLLQAMLLAEDISPSTEDKPQSARSLTSKSPEEVGPLSDPLEAFLEYRRRRAQEYLAGKGGHPRTDPEPSPEKNWSPWFRGTTPGPTPAPESCIWSYLRTCPKLKEGAPSGNEETPRKVQPRALGREPGRSEGSHKAGHQEAQPLDQPRALGPATATLIRPGARPGKPTGPPP